MSVKEAKMKGGACFEAYMAGLFKHVRFQLIFFLSFSCVCTCIQVCLGAPQVINRLFLSKLRRFPSIHSLQGDGENVEKAQSGE